MFSSGLNIEVTPGTQEDILWPISLTVSREARSPSEGPEGAHLMFGLKVIEDLRFGRSSRATSGTEQTG